MSDSFKNGLKLFAYVAWFVAAGFAMVSDIRGIGELYRAIQHTQAMTDTLSVEAQGIVNSAHIVRGGSRDVKFLESLMNLMPQKKSFIRTQQAMSDEVDALRYKVTHRVRNDLQVLVDTRANKLYVKKGMTLLWEADCSVGKGGILRDKVTGRRWEFVTRENCHRGEQETGDRRRRGEDRRPFGDILPRVCRSH